MEPTSDDLAADLPSPREDEPESLRQDILDEVRDHLLCATRREQLLGTTDEQTGWRRALSCFGNPQAMVRQLYWQAMWSRIMQQRIVLVSSAGMLGLGVIMVALMWTMLQRQQEVVQQQLMASERHQANLEALLTRLGTPVPTVGSLKAVLDRPAHATLSGGSLTSPVSADSIPVDGQQDAHEVDFGEMAPGVYSVEIQVPGDWSCEQRVVLRTGETRRVEFRIPHTDIAEVTFMTNLPESGIATMSLAVVRQTQLTYQQREWGRTSVSSSPSGHYRSKPSCRTDLIGPVKLMMCYLPENNLLNPIVCSLSNQIGDVVNGSSPYELRTFDFDLRPGANQCTIEVPQEWMAKIQDRADGIIRGLNVKRINKSVQTLLEREGGRQQIAFLHDRCNHVNEDYEVVVHQCVRDAIRESPTISLIPGDLIEAFLVNEGWRPDGILEPQCRRQLEAFLKDRDHTLDRLLFAKIVNANVSRDGQIFPGNAVRLDLIDPKTGERTTSSVPLNFDE